MELYPISHEVTTTRLHIQHIKEKTMFAKFRHPLYHEKQRILLLNISYSHTQRIDAFYFVISTNSSYARLIDFNLYFFLDDKIIKSPATRLINKN